MEKFEVEEKFNPWTSGNVEDYHYYSCPECHDKHSKKGQFIKHAWMHHPQSAQKMVAALTNQNVWTLDFSDPWIVSSFEDFQFYFCPECEVKTNTKTEFINHAVGSHPRAQKPIFSSLNRMPQTNSENTTVTGLPNGLTNGLPSGFNNGSVNGLPSGFNNKSINGVVNGLHSGLNNGVTITGSVNGLNNRFNNGPTNGSVNGMPNVFNKGQTNGSINLLTNGSVSKLPSGFVNGLLNGFNNGSTNGSVNGFNNGVTNGSANALALPNGFPSGFPNGLPNSWDSALFSALTSKATNRVANGTTNGMANGATNGMINGITNGATNGLNLKIEECKSINPDLIKKENNFEELKNVNSTEINDIKMMVANGLAQQIPQYVSFPDLPKIPSAKIDAKRDPSKYQFKCELCDKSFIHFKNLTNHMKKKHENNDETRFSCDECGNVYAQKHNLEQHIKVKHQNFRYKCPECPELEYSSRSTLDVHIQAKHRGQKFKCTECEAEYAYRHEYVQHMRSIHLGVRYNCDLCGNEFRSKVSLKDHLRSAHEKIKAFKCEVCHRVYARSSCLWVHRKRKHPETFDKEARAPYPKQRIDE